MIIVYKDIITYYEDIFTMKLAGYDMHSIKNMIPYEMTLFLCLEIARKQALDQ